MSSLNGDTEIAVHFCNFINACFDERKEYISHDIVPSEPVYTRIGRLSKAPSRLNL